MNARIAARNLPATISVLFMSGTLDYGKGGKIEDCGAKIAGDVEPSTWDALARVCDIAHCHQRAAGSKPDAIAYFEVIH